MALKVAILRLPWLSSAFFVNLLTCLLTCLADQMETLQMFAIELLSLIDKLSGVNLSAASAKSNLFTCCRASVCQF